MIQVGGVIGNYKIVEEVGFGGMGQVYKCVDLMLDREVAIKVLRPELTTHHSLVERFRKEAMVLARLIHPNIALLYNLFQQDNLFFMVMEFVQGETLDRKIKRDGAMPPGYAITLFVQMLDAIGYAHQHGIIHRDIKPSNIMILPDNRVKVMDFGIARVLGTERMTRDGSVIGTIEYMSPEQVRGHESNAASDIYSLGVLLYEMLTRQIPFPNLNQFDLMRAHIELPPPPLSRHTAGIPEHVEMAVLRALEKYKEDRFATADEFRAALLKTTQMAGHGDTTTTTVRKTITFVPPDIPDEAAQAAAEARIQLIEEARRKVREEARQIAEEERQKLIHEARKQAEEEATRFVQNERQRLLEEARKQAEEEAERLGQQERGRLFEEARKRAEEEATQRAASERLRLIEGARKRAEQEAAQRAASERLRLVEAARRQAEQQASHMAAAERQRLIEEARKRAEDEAARLAAEEERQLVEEARKQAEIEAARFAKEERSRLLDEAHRRAEQQAAERASAERKRLIEDARQYAEQEAAARGAAEFQRLLEEARKEAELEAANLAAEEEERLFEQARKQAEEEASLLASAERTRLLEEARQRAGQEASRKASKERQRLVEAALKQAGEEAARLSEEERERLILEARRQAEEDAARLAEEERHRLLDEARKRAEKEAARRSAKERKRIITDELKRAKQDAQRQSAEIIAQQDQYGTRPLVGDVDLSPHTQYPPEGKSRRWMLWAGAGIVLAVTIAFLAYRTVGTRRNQTAVLNPPALPKLLPPDLVSIPGGTFRMGRDEAPSPGEDQAIAEWQRPSHQETVGPFQIYRTEVTNEEYALFVGETNYQPPSIWVGGHFEAGQGKWPVRGVSLEDARAFANWRSKRDGVTYRLPTEIEWEFAAKGTNSSRFPWGDQWADGFANIGSGQPRPVGSYASVKSPFGVQDMIGNVGEWTSSPASIYPHNGRLTNEYMKKNYDGCYVVRGGNYSSSVRGPIPVSVTVRGFIRPLQKEATIGFRLVREANKPKT